MTTKFRLDAHNVHKFLQAKYEIMCKSGQYVHKRGHVACSDCEPGFYCTASRKGICPRGKYSDTTRSTYCKRCAHSKRAGATVCQQPSASKNVSTTASPTGSPTSRVTASHHAPPITQNLRKVPPRTGLQNNVLQSVFLVIIFCILLLQCWRAGRQRCCGSTRRMARSLAKKRARGQ